MDYTIEDLETELEENYLQIDRLAQRVANKELDAFEGFTLSEKHKNRVVEIGYLLKERGIDITTRVE